MTPTSGVCAPLVAGPALLPQAVTDNASKISGSVRDTFRTFMA
jgi:hypothetical protein